jgi:hypothetical protein
MLKEKEESLPENLMERYERIQERHKERENIC